jgi:NhaA family Na+:H+ antiporter
MADRAAFDFLRSEAAGGIALIAAAATALVVANSPLAPAYFALLHAQAGPLAVHLWINDAAMALFFLLVGLEIKREFVSGELANWAQRRLPVVAAAAGMAVPALVYLAVTFARPELRAGWAIPAATDIAFAIGVLALLGSRVPVSLKLFLTTVAIVDDMGAVAIIAFAYTAAIDTGALVAAALVLLVMAGLNRWGVTRLAIYLPLAVLLWYFVFRSGVHATIAGVLAALTIPIGSDEARSPLHRLEHGLHPWSAFLIVPLFGFANAGVSFAGLSPAILLAPLPLGIALGLFLGKQAGIFGGIWIADRLRFAARPAGANWRQVYGVALLAGIGFTMSLFIGGLAFPGNAALADEVKIGVLAGSLLSAMAGFAVLRFSARAAGADDSAAATSPG